MKHEWRKQEKGLYLPPGSPVRITVPELKFFVLDGEGNPNDDFFADCISVLYSLAYAVKMSPKKDIAPAGYFDYTVYPLEGIWDLNEEAKKSFTGKIDKDSLIFKLMIRQPDFVDEKFALKIIELTRRKKPHDLLNDVRMETIKDGECVQMMHLGSYDNEPESFSKMEAFTDGENLIRESKVHREIYLSDARKVAAEKLKTVLRFKVLDSKKEKEL